MYKNGKLNANFPRTVLGFVASVIFLTYYPCQASTTFKIGLPSLPQSFDPRSVHSAYDSLANGQVFETLYNFGKNSEILPSLAKSHVISPDGKIIRISIKEDQFFSDGSLVTGKIIVDALKSSIAYLGENSRWAFGNVVNFDKFISSKGKDTGDFGIVLAPDGAIEIRLERPFAKFLQILTVRNYSIFKRTNSGELIGSGPYVADVRDSSHVVLSKRKNYDGPDKIEFIKFRNSEHLNLLLKERKIDFTPIMDEQFPDYLGYQKVTYSVVHSVIAFLNLSHPFFKNKGVRCAFLDELESSLKKAGYTWNTIDNGPSFGWSLFKPHKQLRKSTPVSQSIEILYPSSIARFDDKKNSDVSKYMKSSGWNVNFINLGDISKVSQRAKNKNFTVIMAGYNAKYLDAGAFLFPLVQTGQQYNLSGFSDSTVERLLKISNEISDLTSRNVIFSEILDIIDKECPLRILGGQNVQYLVSDEWSIPEINEMGFHHTNFSKLVKKTTEDGADRSKTTDNKSN